MAYTKKFLKRHAEPMERLLHPSDIKHQPRVLGCSDEFLEKINNAIDLKDDLGIYLDEDGKVPESAGIPRIFIMGLDKDGRDRRMSLEEAGVRYGSREFWQQAQQGNVFALPAGEATPVQMTLSRTENMANVTLRPLGVDEVPEIARRPTRWQRFVHFFNRNKYAAEVNGWKNREANRKSNRDMLASVYEARKKVLKDEMDELKVREEEAYAEKQAQKEAGREEREKRKKNKRFRRSTSRRTARTGGGSSTGILWLRSPCSMRSWNGRERRRASTRRSASAR